MTSEEEQAFVEKLYSNCEEQLKTIKEENKAEKEELMQTIAMILLLYTIKNDKLDLNRVEKATIWSQVTKLFKENLTQSMVREKRIITSTLEDSCRRTAKFYGWNINFKDVHEIVDSLYLGENYKTRITNNNKEIYTRLNKEIKDFIDGKTSVNKIKDNLVKLYDYKDYQAKRLIENELSRVQRETYLSQMAFLGEKFVKRNAVLDSKTCDKCVELDGKIYTIEEARDFVPHVSCRCYFTILD